MPGCWHKPFANSAVHDSFKRLELLRSGVMAVTMDRGQVLTKTPDMSRLYVFKSERVFAECFRVLLEMVKHNVHRLRSAVPVVRYVPLHYLSTVIYEAFKVLRIETKYGVPYDFLDSVDVVSLAPDVFPHCGVRFCESIRKILINAPVVWFTLAYLAGFRAPVLRVDFNREGYVPSFASVSNSKHYPSLLLTEGNSRHISRDKFEVVGPKLVVTSIINQVKTLNFQNPTLIRMVSFFGEWSRPDRHKKPENSDLSLFSGFLHFSVADTVAFFNSKCICNMESPIKIKYKSCQWSGRTRPPFGCNGKPTHIVKGNGDYWLPCCTRHVAKFKNPYAVYPNNPFAGLIEREWKKWDFNTSTEISTP